MPSPIETITFAIYADETGGTPLWQETQTVIVDRTGAYNALLGSTVPDGLPQDIFTANEARWLSIHVEGAADLNQSRVLIASVAYALRAADADTLGGKPASAYVLANPPAGSSHTSDPTTSTTGTGTKSSSSLTLGTPGRLAMFADTVNLGDSVVTQSGARIGVGTVIPADYLHIAFTDPFGAFTGLAVQNLSNNANAASGMLFYDQNGALAQFQGFNNANHAYVINNIAKNGSSQFDGSISFLVGSAPRFTVASSGNVGVGTSTPTANFEVTNGATGTANTVVSASAFSNAAGGGAFAGRKARGTSAAPTAAQNGDTLATLSGRGFGATTFGGFTGAINIVAAENFTDAAKGTALNFVTTPLGTLQTGVGMTLAPNGNLGVGNTNPSKAVDIIRSGQDGSVSVLSYGGESDLFLASGRGTSAAPAAVQAGDILGAVVAGGIDSTLSGQVGAFIGAAATESWTGTAHGSAVGIGTTAIGTVSQQINLAVLSNGFVAIGTPVDVNGIPTATDRLQVFGDMRVGNSGTNGCVKSFDGTGITGTCASDLRFKKDITPFAPALASLTALRPVHYSWRTTEFPDRHFGTSRAYGLIAQEVEKVLPELVATDEEGYKAVDYGQLPLLTVQAVKELKNENDVLKARVAELERAVNDLLAGARR